MTMAGFALRRATHDDVEALCDVYLSAFRDEVFSRQVFPREPSSDTGRAYWRRAFAEELREPDATFLVAVEPCYSDDDNDDDGVRAAAAAAVRETAAAVGETTAAVGKAAASRETVVGFVKWVAPGAPPHDFSEDGGGYPPDGLPDVAALYYKRLFEGHRRCVGDRPHWYLDMVGVRREVMGRGAARQLLDWGLQRAARDGVPCFVESTGDARAFYERFGFSEVDRMSVDTPQGEAVVVFMLREGAFAPPNG
ncbi:hypothetical protein JDV02_004838 [Purpureocillium takamizusanense]|uniref:N-acetyltransferase domain-containing protein n=1 Tax=Purpureocillium takamizusanense TaxID=2060973 RepID=A0A9Q8QF88_9HYPO|nr:uncharacterized protein JDV02_004838 [Purpureocillium takamizusanense]UNI18580.1 hypothetical protein JDV02_004838 [Purpureocillium takamizusanense]